MGDVCRLKRTKIATCNLATLFIFALWVVLMVILLMWRHVKEVKSDYAESES